MPIDFFKDACKSESSKTEFGLCDDIANSPAYIDENTKTKWIGVVKNPNGRDAQFYAIDNCLGLRRADGTLESSCDGVLKESLNLIFVELKERQSGSWFGDGRKQLTNTIKIFKANHNVADFSSITAHVCNNLKPLANSGRAVAIQMFKDDTGYILRDTMEINI